MDGMDGFRIIAVLLAVGIPLLASLAKAARGKQQGTPPTQKNPLSGDLSNTPPTSKPAKPSLSNLIPSLEELIEQLGLETGKTANPVHSLPPTAPLQAPASEERRAPAAADGHSLETAHQESVQWVSGHVAVAPITADESATQTAAPERTIRQLIIADAILNRRSGPHKPARRM